MRKRLHNSQAMINAGMICCATGVVAQRFIHPPTDFWQGFVAGLSGVLIGLSIVFNMRGLMLRRRHHDIGR
ncbi:MAG: hypothetical protein OEV48_08895 [Acidobacteriota bacterium]|nr:hypothetical protein [Acidobacteriota bacterium]